ncbi:hypothetical protein [Flavonifractor plautii]|nr:hypothetical protein GXM20_16815 [Flavonifractor plautii]
MMRGELLCWDGRRIRLPDAVEWQFQYGCGTPCDSFQLTCLWEPDSGNDLTEAVSFTAEENGERLFTGVVDECERGWDTAGGTLTVAGRGMAARLLDNEALGADYQVATVEDILRDHVAPYGIEIVRGAELPPVPGFSVDAGSSEWQVVYEFCRYYGGIAPRFDRLGRLVLAPWEEGRRLVLGADAAVTSFRLREQRYGVLSEVLVRDRTTEEVQRVADEDFLRRGGRCRRVLTMPGKSSYQAMRYSGAYQLARAREELRQAELELPEAFAAWPGELVELNLAKGTGRGLWRVRESVCGLTAAGTYTRLTLGEP